MTLSKQLYGLFCEIYSCHNIPVTRKTLTSFVARNKRCLVIIKVFRLDGRPFTDSYSFLLLFIILPTGFLADYPWDHVDIWHTSSGSSYLQAFFSFFRYLPLARGQGPKHGKQCCTPRAKSIERRALIFGM